MNKEFLEKLVLLYHQTIQDLMSDYKNLSNTHDFQLDRPLHTDYKFFSKSGRFCINTRYSPEVSIVDGEYVISCVRIQLFSKNSQIIREIVFDQTNENLEKEDLEKIFLISFIRIFQETLHESVRNNQTARECEPVSKREYIEQALVI